MRSLLLACSRSQWLRKEAPRLGFVRRAVSRFMPGEALPDALDAASALQAACIGTVFTYLGENVTDPAEAGRVTEHYLEVLGQIDAHWLPTEISVKPTQLGLDLDKDLCFSNLSRIIERAAITDSRPAGEKAGNGPSGLVWIDMESSRYVDPTLELFERARHLYPNVGVCLQAYLYRTAEDLERLLPLRPAIRLVKGAYQESPSVAFPKKHDVDENYFQLARKLLDAELASAGARAAIATHDRAMINRVIGHVRAQNLSQASVEFQMLYGIERGEQLRLAREGWRSIVLIAYGSYWFPWYMRRLAERPANAWFVLRSLFSG